MKCFQNCTVEYGVHSRLLMCSLYYVEVCFLYPHSLKNFFYIINGCWILLKAFCASTEMIIWFLFFSVLMWFLSH